MLFHNEFLVEVMGIQFSSENWHMPFREFERVTSINMNRSLLRSEHC